MRPETPEAEVTMEAPATGISLRAAPLPVSAAELAAASAVQRLADGKRSKAWGFEDSGAVEADPPTNQPAASVSNEVPSSRPPTAEPEVIVEALAKPLKAEPRLPLHEHTADSQASFASPASPTSSRFAGSVEALSMSGTGDDGESGDQVARLRAARLAAVAGRRARAAERAKAKAKAKATDANVGPDLGPSTS